MGDGVLGSRILAWLSTLPSAEVEAELAKKPKADARWNVTLAREKAAIVELRKAISRASSDARRRGAALDYTVHIPKDVAWCLTIAWENRQSRTGRKRAPPEKSDQEQYWERVVLTLARTLKREFRAAGMRAKQATWKAAESASETAKSYQIDLSPNTIKRRIEAKPSAE